MGLVEIVQVFKHAQRHVGTQFGVVRAGDGDARCSHIGVANGFDLLQAQAVGAFVKPGEQVIEHLDELGGTDLGRQLGKAHQVAEQNGGLGVAARDIFLAPLQPLGNRPRQDVEHELVGLHLLQLEQLLFLVYRHHAQLVQIPQAFERQMVPDPRQHNRRADRLGEVVGRTQVQAFLFVVSGVHRRQKNDRDVAGGRVAFELLAHLVA